MEDFGGISQTPDWPTWDAKIEENGFRGILNDHTYAVYGEVLSDPTLPSLQCMLVRLDLLVPSRANTSEFWWFPLLQRKYTGEFTDDDLSQVLPRLRLSLPRLITAVVDIFPLAPAPSSEGTTFNWTTVDEEDPYRYVRYETAWSDSKFTLVLHRNDDYQSSRDPGPGRSSDRLTIALLSVHDTSQIPQDRTVNLPLSTVSPDLRMVATDFKGRLPKMYARFLAYQAMIDDLLMVGSEYKQDPQVP